MNHDRPKPRWVGRLQLERSRANERSARWYSRRNFITFAVSIAGSIVAGYLKDFVTWPSTAPERTTFRATGGATAGGAAGVVRTTSRFATGGATAGGAAGVQTTMITPHTGSLGLSGGQPGVV